MVAYAGFFDDVSKAQTVLKALKDKNYREEEVLLIEPASGDDLKKALTFAKNRDYLSSGLADRAASGLEKRPLLIVKARLGSGLMVEKLYADNGAEMLSSWAESTGHTFFSDLVGLPMVTSTRSSSRGSPEARRPLTEAMFPCIIKREGARDSSLGMPLLGKPLWFSHTLGIPLLSKQKTGN